MLRTKSVAWEAVPSVTLPGFQCLQTLDSFGRTITFYLSQAETPETLPLIIFIQGSGCHSAFRKGPDGRIYGGYQNVLLRVAGTGARVLVVEKPGVRPMQGTGNHGVARGCSREFLEEHTLPRWAEAITASLRAARLFKYIDRRKTLLVGHSEGGLVAARVAAENKCVSHVAVLSSSGPTQLFDLAAQVPVKAKNTKAGASTEAWARSVYRTFERIRSDPQSISKFAWGHPYRRWSSFLATSVLDELLRTKARVYVAHGSQDAAVPIAAFDVLRAELIRHGRNLTTRRIEDADHAFATSDRVSPGVMMEVFAEIVKWFMLNRSRTGNPYFRRIVLPPRPRG